MYLWVNLPDLQSMGTIGPVGSPLNLMLRDGERIERTIYHPSHLDEVYLVIPATEERCAAISGGLEVISRRKIGRKIRLKTTAKLPGDTWRVVTG